MTGICSEMKKYMCGDVLHVEGIRDFHLDHIFDCGQCFRWSRNEDGSYTGIAFGRVAKIAYDADKQLLMIHGADEEDFEIIWRDYLDLDRDYGSIKAVLADRDPVIRDAIEYGHGIRILNQEKWETLLSFIISQNNNIPRIKGCVEKICRDYGDKIEISDAFKIYLKENAGAEVGEVHAFPSCEQLLGVKADEYSVCCKAGYRCAYLEKTVSIYMEHPELLAGASQGKSTLAEARGLVKSFCGVGPKVADCILLFAGLRTDVFPVDVWVRRVLEDLYFHREVSQKEAESFAAEYFGDLAGFAQQYLFYSMRENSK